jgi:hypothetical protein
MSSTYYLPNWKQIMNPKHYTVVPVDNLRINHYYSYKVGMWPDDFSCVKILLNNDHEVHYEMYNNVFTLKKHEVGKKNINRRTIHCRHFYELNHYYSRENYILLCEGLLIDPEKRQPLNIRYLLNPEIQKEISSYLH